MDYKKLQEDLIAARLAGEQNHHPMEWLSILGEEFREVCKAACEAHFKGYASTGNWSEYRKELI